MSVQRFDGESEAIRLANDVCFSDEKHSGHDNDMSVLAIADYTTVKHVMSSVAGR